MPQYRYRAVDDQGTPLEGTMEESSAYRVTTILRERGLQVSSVDEVGPPAPLPRQTAALSWRDIDLFNEQLLAIVRSKLPLAPALKALSEDLRDSKFRSVIDDVRARIERGETLEAALAMHPRSFPPVYLAAIRAGEQTGNLAGVLTLLSSYSRRMVEFQYRAKELLAYPILVLIASGCVVGFLLVRTIPLFSEVFGDFGARLPWLTQFWIDVADGLRNHYGVWLFALAAVVMAVKAAQYLARRSSQVVLMFETIQRFTPIYRVIHRLKTTARFSRTLGILLTSNVPITDSIELAAGASGSLRLYREMQKVQESVAGGSTPGDALKRSGYFDPFFCWLVGMSENRGDLGEALQSLAGAYEERLGGASNMAVKFIAPAIVVCVGAVVASIVIALYLPIFTLGDVISGS